MKIASTTQSNNRSAVIGDALKSVLPFVDACLVFDSGITDNTLDVAKQIAGTKLIVQPFDWKADFASARNNHLDQAHALGFDWAVTLDTDERLTGLTRESFNTSADVLFVNAQDGTYTKQRAFRLPCKGRWTGKAHEAFVPNGAKHETVKGASFAEVPHAPDHLRSKFEEVIKILSASASEDSKNPRTFYYLADAYDGLGNTQVAIDYFQRCADLNGWKEEGAWAMFRAAECHCRRGEYPAAKACCLKGLAIHPGIAELPRLIAFLCFTGGDMAGAICWAKMSAALGCAQGIGLELERIGFKQPWALYEGPFDILRRAYTAIGDLDRAAQAQLDLSAAFKLRLQATNP